MYWSIDWRCAHRALPSHRLLSNWLEYGLNKLPDKHTHIRHTLSSYEFINQLPYQFFKSALSSLGGLNNELIINRAKNRNGNHSRWFVYLAGIIHAIITWWTLTKPLVNQMQHNTFRNFKCIWGYRHMGRVLLIRRQSTGVTTPRKDLSQTSEKYVVDCITSHWPIVFISY